MNTKKKNPNDKRKEEKVKRLNSISEEVKNVSDNKPVTEDELKETSSKVINSFYIVNEDDLNVIKSEKSLLQRELDTIKSPEIKEIPDFLTDKNKSEDRKAVMDKIKYLLKHRFSLVIIADILECNDYDKLDEIIEQKDSMYKLTEKYSRESGLKPIKLFSDFKESVGGKYSKVYNEQEQRMKTAINDISEGIYFRKKDNPELAIEDIVSKVIDHPDFNLACQIETKFMSYELDRAITILSDLNSRSELQNLIEDLRKTYLDIEGRSHAFDVMDKIITGADKRMIIEKKEKDNGEER